MVGNVSKTTVAESPGGNGANPSPVATTVILSNTMSKEELVSAINGAKPGTEFIVQGYLNLLSVNVAFPSRSIIHTGGHGQVNINFGYSDAATEFAAEKYYNLVFGDFCTIHDISITINDYDTATMVRVYFCKGCTAINCAVNGYEPCTWESGCTCRGCSFQYQMTGLSEYGSFTGCYLSFCYGVDLTKTHVANCRAEAFYPAADTSTEMLKAVKAMNPDMKVYDDYGQEVPLPLVTENYINTIIQTAIEGEY